MTDKPVFNPALPTCEFMGCGGIMERTVWSPMGETRRCLKCGHTEEIRFGGCKNGGCE